jgi:2'-5' RNA ligase
MRAVAEESTEKPAGDGDAFGGGMIALVPDEASAVKLAVQGGEDLDELHLTLTYLGPDIEQVDEAQRRRIVDAAGRLAEATAPVQARIFGHATFNPDGHDDREPCAVYLIGDTDALGPLKDQLDRYASAEQHEPYYPHVTGGYGLTAADLTYTGSVTFNVLRVAMGEANIIIPLTGGEEETSDDDTDEPAGDQEGDPAE